MVRGARGIHLTKHMECYWFSQNISKLPKTEGLETGVHRNINYKMCKTALLKNES